MADTATEVTPTKAPKKRINYALAATLVTTGVTLAEAAKHCGAANGESLRRGLVRKGVTARRARAMEPIGERAVSVTLKLASQASELLREDLASVLAKHTTALKDIPAKPNLKHIKAVGDAIEPLARTAKIVHDWGNQSKEGLAMIGLWQEPAPQEPEKPALDIQAVVGEPKPEQNPS